MAVVQNYLNYIGSKDRYLPQIIKLIKEAKEITKADSFVDLFCGSAVVAVNVADLFKNTYCYDACEQLIGIHNWVKKVDQNKLFQNVDTLIDEYDLSKTNKDGFLKLRSAYNALVPMSRVTKVPMMDEMLYCLVTHSYNYSFHFNKKGEYNAPAGTNRSSLNSSLRAKLYNFKRALDSGINIDFCDVDFQDVIFRQEPQVIFVDPPYSASISKHPYRNAKLKWGDEEDRKLTSLLDTLDKKGSKFIFTNVLSNNGVSNIILQNWIKEKGYKVHKIDVTYNNCSYQRRNLGDTEEVIITNF